MGLFAMNMEDEPTVKGLLESALANLELYLPYCSVVDSDGRTGRYKDELGQTPPDYLIKDFAIYDIRKALEILNRKEV